MKNLQKLGKAMMQPVAVLPIAALLSASAIGLTRSAGAVQTSLQPFLSNQAQQF